MKFRAGFFEVQHTYRMGDDPGSPPSRAGQTSAVSILDASEDRDVAGPERERPRVQQPPLRKAPVAAIAVSIANDGGHHAHQHRHPGINGTNVRRQHVGFAHIESIGR